MKAGCFNSVLRFLTLTSNEEGSRFWYKNHTVSLEKYWLTFVKPLIFSCKGGGVMNRLVYFLMVGLVFMIVNFVVGMNGLLKIG